MGDIINKNFGNSFSKLRIQNVFLLISIVLSLLSSAQLVKDHPQYPNSSIELNEVTNFTPSSASNTLCTIKVINTTDWALSHYETYLLSSLEGLINQPNSSELIYIMDSPNSLLWLSKLDPLNYSIEWLNITDLSQLISYFKPQIHGFIIWDNLPESGNIATPLSGIFKSLLVHNSLFAAISPLFVPSLPIYENLTLEYQTQGFTEESTRDEIYAWAFDSYFSSCSQTALGMINPDVSGHIRSQLCAEGIFTFWQPMYIDGEADPMDSAADLNRFESILSASPSNMIVYGYMMPYGANEHPVVRELTTYGKYLVPSDWLGQAPFWKSLPISEDFSFSQESSRNISSIPLENKLYVAGIYSDGDNMQYIANFLMPHLWEGVHGTVPTTYEMTPSIMNIAPAMAMVFYNEMTDKDYFVNGVGGKGYVKSEYASSAFFDTFWTDTRDLMNILDQREVRTWNSGNISQIISNMQNSNAISPRSQVECFIEGYMGSSNILPFLIDEVPFMQMYGYSARNASEYEEEKNMLLDLLQYKQKGPMFVNMHLLCWDSPYNVWANFVSEMESLSNGQIVFVTTGQLSRLMNQANLSESNLTFDFVGLFLVLSAVTAIFILSYLESKKNREILRKHPEKEEKING